jgi:hypothetical protein
MFNQLPGEVNEALVRGREEIFFGAEFAASAGTTKLPDDAVKYYIDVLAADPEALRGSFEFYHGRRPSKSVPSVAITPRTPSRPATRQPSERLSTPRRPPASGRWPLNSRASEFNRRDGGPFSTGLDRQPRGRACVCWQGVRMRGESRLVRGRSL